MATFVGSRFSEERNENSLFEGLSRLMGAVIVGTSEHVAAGPMASHIVKNGSRFKFSHKFQHVPLREAMELLEEENCEHTKMSTLGHRRGCFLTSQAINYLKRPKALENCNMHNFFKHWTTVRNPNAGEDESEKKEEVHEIDDVDHPGFERQQIRKSKEVLLPQFCHWSFPDASHFEGNIMEMDGKNVNGTVERHCRAALVLFCAHRSKGDLTVEGSHFKKFRRLCHAGVPDKIREVLNNTQMHCNSGRMPGREDPVRDVTKAHRSPFEEKEKEEECEEIEDEHLEGLLSLLSGNRKLGDEFKVEENMSFANLRKAGGRGCGFCDLPEVMKCGPCSDGNDMLSWVGSKQGEKRNRDDDKSFHDRDHPSQHHLMELTHLSTKRKIEKEDETTEDDEVEEEKQSNVVANGTALSIVQWSKQKHLNMDDEQQLAFQIVTAAFVITHCEDSRIACVEGRSAQKRHDFLSEKKKLEKLCSQKQLIMFLDGPGGSGKSRVVKELLKCGKEHTERLSCVFDMRTIVVTALSGVAAVSIGGETIHSAAAMNRKIADDDQSWVNARLLVVDEVSFMNSKDLMTLDEKLRKLMRSPNALYGGLHVLFCGDFRQLEPVTGKPLYSQRSDDKHWANSINCHVELFGLHRFKDDEEWGRTLQRMRNDELTTFDIDKINERLIDGGHVKKSDVPGNASHCVCQNVDRSAINTGVFSQALVKHWRGAKEVPRNMLIIKADEVKKRSQKRQGVATKKEDVNHIFQNCGDAKFRTTSSLGKGHFVDPLLKLYHGMPLMMLSNDDVPNGHANGTRVLLEGVRLKENAVIETVRVDGKMCPIVGASEVENLLCVAEGKKKKEFVISPKKMTCSVKVPLPQELGGNGKHIQFTLSLNQVPLINNIATTGHKLQGQTKSSLVTSVWSKRKNWNYVALSRVTTRDGLFLVKKLPYDCDFSFSAELREMMKLMRKRCVVDIEFDLKKEEEIQMQRLQRHWNTPHQVMTQLVALT